MTTRTKLIAAVMIAACLAGAAVSYLAYRISPAGIIAAGNPHAGKWHDDPNNWARAFGSNPPPDVSVIHSYYWASDHFTTEYIYFFEVKASRTWINAFLSDRAVESVVATNARPFTVGYDDVPAWFVTSPIENYDVWDKPGYFGSIWLNRSNNHLYFYGVKL